MTDVIVEDSNGEISDSLMKKVSYGWRSISSKVKVREKELVQYKTKNKEEKKTKNSGSRNNLPICYTQKELLRRSIIYIQQRQIGEGMS